VARLPARLLARLLARCLTPQGIFSFFNRFPSSCILVSSSLFFKTGRISDAKLTRLAELVSPFWGSSTTTIRMLSNFVTMVWFFEGPYI
jgi:hypothetical protein